ncbi:hypothetical protein PGT21_028702 [Puccinia graminis f. sp. tritici]|uniref:Amidohydrolase 3 domain-containing protein n=1 Tax=Puccinia graminis f. sp. tritici TaxID=56615 RepID=A0A5B0P876_PUCGR|nr:hypothetical protein PGTUg99_008068 [Puccinia graminis f. sp. tritici]KAA1104636.1 hypothetical protein PGT21_028702 [Puccinia graminis f. sp. tritici]
MPSPAPVRNSEKLDKGLAQSHKDGTRRTGNLTVERPCIFGWKNVAWMITPFLIAYLTYRFQPVLPGTHAVCVSGGTIYTAEPDSPFVECIAVKGNRISFAGKRDELEKSHAQPGWLDRMQAWLKFSYSTNGGQLAIDTLDGEVSLLPGLIDAHAHPLEYGEGLVGVDLVGCKSVQSIIDRIISHPSLQSANPNLIIRGSGWDQTLFEGKHFPTAAALSSNPKLQGKKIVLRRIDYHAYWVSEAVLDSVLAKNPPLDMEGGEVVKDQDGNPTGVFVDNAMDLIDAIIPERTDEDRFRYLESTAKEMLSVGLTTVNDAATDLETIRFYKALDDQDKLPVRVTGMVNCGYTYCGDQVEKITGNKFNLRSVKLFVDGALGSWGAALWEPYSDLKSSRGVLRAPEEAFLPLIQRWVEAGFQVNSHAIGDRANTLVIDAYENVLSNLNRSTHSARPFNFPRLRIEHAQILRLADIERIGKMGIIASVQPTHAIADMDYAEARLGSERIRGAYAWNSLFKNNVTLALGSDFPVSSVSPFLGIHAAFTRRKPGPSENDDHQGWYPSERIESLQQIIDGFTIHASFAGFTEHLTGSLRVGKLADFVIINQNLFDSSKSRDQISERILNAQVLATVLNGQIVFGKI